MKNIPKSQLIVLEKKITGLVAALNEAVEWSNKYLKGEQRNSTNKRIKKIRRELKKIRFAIAQNPSAALYGESQVGKSYLISNLLSTYKDGLDGLWVKDYTQENTWYNLKRDFDPAGRGTEATSVVSRFSTHVDLIDNRYPVTIKLLSPKDIVLMLADSYFSDVKKHRNLPRIANIQEQIEKVGELIQNSRTNQQFLTEDDVYDIQEYLEKHFNNLTIDLLNSDFWDIVASNIYKIDYSEWSEVFDIIWGGNELISDIYQILVNELARLKFTPVVYTGFRTVLRKYGTLLSVARLKEIYGHGEVAEELENFEPEAKVISAENKNAVVTIKKSLLCALTAELVFKLEKDLEETKPFLKGSDLLDFPGARSRLVNEEADLGEEHISEMVLRGKVGFIFNKYSSQYLISNLLFCHNDKQCTARFIPDLLYDWITSYIGETPAKRQEFLNVSPLPPLFVVYTFFNTDIQYNVNTDEPSTLKQKWFKRFIKIFELEFVPKSEDKQWHKNWTTHQRYFKNNYMLRDFQYSDSFFRGYADEDKKEKEIVPIPQFPDYHKKLKESFIEYDFVKKHFRNPEQSWEAAATLNHDGSQLVIDNLTQVSTNYARTQKFVRELNALSKTLHDEMKSHHHSDDKDEEIVKANKKAGKIHFYMDVVFGGYPYAFGNFIKAFLIKESIVYNFYKDQLNNLEWIKHTDPSALIIIRKRCPALSPQKTYEENLEVVRAAYNFDTIEEAETYLIEAGINPEDLFYGQQNLIKSHSQVLAEKLRDHWFTNYLNKERFSYVIERGFNETALEDLFENIRRGYYIQNIDKIISENIREFVDGFDKVEVAEEMIADISASIINKFLTSMGWDFYSKEQLEGLRMTNNANQLNLNFKANQPPYEVVEEEQIVELFDNIDRYNELIGGPTIDHDAIKNFPNMWNISRWSDLMHISFIANCDIPTYDIFANKALGVIMDHLKAYHFEITQVEDIDMSTAQKNGTSNKPQSTLKGKTSLARFIKAQEKHYDTALKEIKSQKKRSHWMWYIFPQLKDLGKSQKSKFYGIENLAEAERYLKNPFLRMGLLEISQAMLDIDGKTATEILGKTDTRKLQSCMTLFAAAANSDPIFEAVLNKYYNGKKDQRTLQILNHKG